MPLLVILLLVGALLLLWLGRKQHQESGLPVGRIIYTDPAVWGKTEAALYDSSTGLTGRPDYLVQQGENTIPVELKSRFAPAVPYNGHVLQLVAYCRLVEVQTGRRPPYGILVYRNRSFAIDYTSALENELLALLKEVRQQEARGEPDRSHEEPVRCERCGFRNTCNQRF
ncbi:MAG TPA: Dna2/Cas4 domain-containing protein [Anaerolineaceae bacterium]|mgnify:CR=1 FL=1|jgi:CRISPR-associated exonuclease Cas4|nr:Dna2/Cas4 domain-containing protein [Anaerolineaceae bacterium]